MVLLRQLAAPVGPERGAHHARRADGGGAAGRDALLRARAGSLDLGPVLQRQDADGQGVHCDGGQQRPGQGDRQDACHEERQGHHGLQGHGCCVFGCGGHPQDYSPRRAGQYVQRKWHKAEQLKRRAG